MAEIPIVQGFATLFSNGLALFLAVLGTLMGLMAGAIPGLSASAAIALMIPLTYYMDPVAALGFIYAISKAASFGGSIPAILFNTPGTPQASATQIEGFPMTQKGQQGKALRTAVTASATGDTFSELCLIFGAVYVATYAARLGPPEYFAVYCCAFIIIGSVIGNSVVKGLLSTLIGILLSLVGFDPITGEPRYHFGMDHLADGLALVPVLLGVFVMSEVFVRIADRQIQETAMTIAPPSTNPADNHLSWREYRELFPTIARSTGYGTAIGMLPGVGASVACFVAYSEARRTFKRRDRWGKGEVAGVAAAEAANNATSGANMIPLLSLGIPGSAAAALLGGVLLIHGINVGPRVFVDAGQVIYGMFAAGLLCIFTYFVVGYYASGLIGRVIAVVPARMIYPFIFVISFVAAYALRQTLFDVAVMCIFGVVGYLMKRWGFSVPAFIIAFILGSGAEQSLRQALLLSPDGAMIFLQRPIALVFFALGILALVLRVRQLSQRGHLGAPGPATAE